MKKVLYILSVMLLAAVGCTKEQSRTESSEKNAFPEGAMVTVNFSIPSQAETRANGMADEPQIENLYVAVFNSAGLLREYTKAEPETVMATQDEVWYTYKVKLLLSSTERHLHFIANAPETIENGTESVVIRNLITENGAAAYWQRVVLTEGITPYAYKGGEVTFKWIEDGVEQTKIYGSTGADSYTDAEGKTVNVGDYVQENGNKVVDGTGYFASVETSSALEKIPLIRNFARITIMDAGDGEDVHFHPTQFIVVNKPTQGYVAPYDSKIGDYVMPYTDVYSRRSEPWYFELDDLLTCGYPAEMPATSSIKALTQTEVEALEFKSLGEYDFMYERALPTKTESPTCVLVQGTLDDTPEHASHPNRWFKIEITDLDGYYLPIYRDVTYVMMIKNITIVGTPGWATPWEAYKNKSVGDVSNSAETATLEQISDGKGTTLWVEYIDYTSIHPTGETVPILYKLFYKENSSSEEEILTDTIESLTVEHSAQPAITVDEITGTAYSGTTPDGKGGWYVAQVPLAGQGDLFKKSTLHIEGDTKAGNGTKVLFRDVDFRVIPTQNLVVTATPTAAPTVMDEEVKLSITIPKELGYSMFPLVLKIEPEAGNLNPDANKNEINGVPIGLPVQYGESMFEDKTTSSFWFLFTVNYSDYDPVNGSTFDLYFKTIQSGDNSTAIRVWDNNDPHFFNFKDIEI